MLIPKNINPDECIYYKAARVLKIMLARRSMSVADLYVEVNAESKMSYFVFQLCLDWLYLIGCISYTNNPYPQITICT